MNSRFSDLKKQADEMALLYQVGISLASGKNLFDTMLALRSEISKLIQHDAFFVAIYDYETGIVDYPVFFLQQEIIRNASRLLKESPGLTGAVIFSGKTLYLPDILTSDVERNYSPVNANELTVHTFLGVPLISNDVIIGMISIQSNMIDAYTREQIQLMENLAVQAAIAIDKARLFDQLQAELIERRKMEAVLLKRESMLAAVTFAAEQFLKSSNWRDKMNAVLERLGRELNASHAYLFEKHEDQNGQMLSSMSFEWTAPGHKTDLGDPDFQDMEPNYMGFERYYEILDSGAPLVGSTSFFRDEEKKYMNEIGVKALLEMRVIVDGRQWGTLGVDDVVNEREWTSSEVDVIKAATGVLGAAVKRQLDEEAGLIELEKRKTLIHELGQKNEELERFVYTVSHDLKSPLVTINGFLGYLEQDAVSGNLERHRKDLLRIQSAVQKMERLLKELLELSRIGRMKNESVAISFNNLVAEALEQVEGRLQKGRISVSVEENLPIVYGDHQRLLEVLQNLLDNAAKFCMENPAPKIEVGQRGFEAGLPVFFVRDNGVGIAPEHFERIFGLFNKLDATSEGTGVGLALVKRIVEIHGGRVWVESQYGQGSSFLFTLPVNPSQ
jgi:signal transduction histidine kinase